MLCNAQQTGLSDRAVLHLYVVLKWKARRKARTVQLGRNCGIRLRSTEKFKHTHIHEMRICLGLPERSKCAECSGLNSMHCPLGLSSIGGNPKNKYKDGEEINEKGERNDNSL